MNFSNGFAQKSTGKEYDNGHGGKIFMPMGDISFADEVVNFKAGNPKATPTACDPLLSIGIPDYAGSSSNFLSLGCGGSLTLLFTDNAIVNIAGPDLFVFEVGKYVEATKLEISKDGVNWINVGKISGGVSMVDFGDSVKPGKVFHYVRLTDLKADCKGDWPGADIDAVAAIGSGKQLTLDNGALFKVGEFNLMPNSKKGLSVVMEDIKSMKPSQIVIEGHSDNTGKEEANLILSKKRAQSVADYIKSTDKSWSIPINIEGYGSSLPISSNETKQGQEKNRRVNIILIP